MHCSRRHSGPETNCCTVISTLSEPQSRSGDKPLKAGVVCPPKRGCGSKGVERVRYCSILYEYLVRARTRGRGTQFLQTNVNVSSPAEPPCPFVLFRGAHSHTAESCNHIHTSSRIRDPSGCSCVHRDSSYHTYRSTRRRIVSSGLRVPPQISGPITAGVGGAVLCSPSLYQLFPYTRPLAQSCTGLPILRLLFAC